MRKIIGLMALSISLLVLITCVDKKTRIKAVYINNNVDTTLLLVNMDINRGFDPYCYMHCIERIAPGNTVVMQIEEDKYEYVSFTMNVYKDLFENEIDKDTLSDCAKRKAIMEKSIIRKINIPERELERINYTIVLDSILLGLKK